MFLNKKFDIEYVTPGNVGWCKSFVFFFFNNKEKNTSRLFFSIANYKNKFLFVSPPKNIC